MAAKAMEQVAASILSHFFWLHSTWSRKEFVSWCLKILFSVCFLLDILLSPMHDGCCMLVSRPCWNGRWLSAKLRQPSQPTEPKRSGCSNKSTLFRKAPRSRCMNDREYRYSAGHEHVVVPCLFAAVFFLNAPT